MLEATLECSVYTNGKKKKLAMAATDKNFEEINLIDESPLCVNKQIDQMVCNPSYWSLLIFMCFFCIFFGALYTYFRVCISEHNGSYNHDVVVPILVWGSLRVLFYSFRSSSHCINIFLLYLFTPTLFIFQPTLLFSQD